MIIKCGKCAKVGEAEEVKVYMYYRCKYCKALNEVFNVRLKEWLGFNYSKYLESIESFLKNYTFDDVLAKTAIDLQAGRLTIRQVDRLRSVLLDGFTNELNLLQIAENIDKQVNPKDLFRMKDGKIVRKDGTPVLRLSAGQRGMFLARTETTRAGAEGSLDHYEKGKVVEVRFVASLGLRTCPICQSLNGQIFPLAESTGVIPVHGYCRCTWVPV